MKQNQYKLQKNLLEIKLYRIFFFFNLIKIYENLRLLTFTEQTFIEHSQLRLK